MTILIAHINNYPEYVSDIAEWYMSFWGKKYPERTKSDWQADIGRSSDKPPITLIAIDTNKNPPVPVGTASLKLGGMDKYDLSTAWLSALYVIPEYRGKNIASDLIGEIIKLAGKRYEELYLFTRTDGRIYKKLGWGVMEFAEYQGGEVCVMKKSLLDKELCPMQCVS